jgi:hypothetical protein
MNGKSRLRISIRKSEEPKSFRLKSRLLHEKRPHQKLTSKPKSNVRPTWIRS